MRMQIEAAGAVLVTTRHRAAPARAVGATEAWMSKMAAALHIVSVLRKKSWRGWVHSVRADDPPRRPSALAPGPVGDRSTELTRGVLPKHPWPGSAGPIMWSWL